MLVGFTGAANCIELQSTRVQVNSGSTALTITSTSDGFYAGCFLYINDHAGLRSNNVALPEVNMDDDVT